MGVKKIKIKYVKATDFKTATSTGVYGGITTNGLINGNFFIDRVMIPTHENYEIEDQTGQIIKLESQERDGDLIREVQFGLLLDVQTAEIIAKWLTDKVNEQKVLFKNKI